VKRLLTIAVFVATILALPASPAFAQQGDRIIDGVITGVTASQAGELVSFKLVDSAGQDVELKVQGGAQPTAYGLENQAGDRWISDQAREPVEAARRLRDHQARFAAVTVTLRGDTALNVVEKEGGNLETNLGYLFALYTVTWAAFFAYVFYLSRRQRDLQREIGRLKDSMRGDKRQ
jgi:CcmD family protein